MSSPGPCPECVRLTATIMELEFQIGALMVKVKQAQEETRNLHRQMVLDAIADSRYSKEK